MQGKLPRRLVITLAICLSALLLSCLLAARSVAAQRLGQGMWLQSPPIGGHMYSIGLLPCGPSSPGQILLGRDVMLYSRYPPPGWSLPLTPACP